jgi:hypothetical protein
VSWACAFGSPPFCGGHPKGGGVPVAPVGAGLGLTVGAIAEKLGEGRAMVGLGFGALVVGPTDGAGEGVTTGAQATTSATARGAIRRIGTFVV